MTYDLRGYGARPLIRRLAHSHRHELTPDGQRLAVFFTKTYARIVHPPTRRVTATRSLQAIRRLTP
jgi:hypothetical protein